MTHKTLRTDRDPGHWPLSHQEQEQRRSIFWMVYRGEMWEVHCHHIPSRVNDLTSAQSLSCGRVTRLSTASIDCRFPSGIARGSPGVSVSQAMHQANPQLRNWISRWARNSGGGHRMHNSSGSPCLLDDHRPGHEVTRAPDGGRTQLEFFQSWRIPSYLLRFVFCAVSLHPLSKTATALIHLHRVFFARALRDAPANPASTMYGPSFHATVRAVREVMDWLFTAYNTNPDLATCFSYEWTTGVTAAVCYCAGVCNAIGLRDGTGGLGRSDHEFSKPAARRHIRADEKTG
jgi:hypothetical protein